MALRTRPVSLRNVRGRIKFGSIRRSHSLRKPAELTPLPIHEAGIEPFLSNYERQRGFATPAAPLIRPFA